MSEKDNPSWPLPHWACLMAVLLVGLGLRLVYLEEIRSIGFFDYPVSDARIYDQRAVEIAAGDWLGSSKFVHAPLYAYGLAGVYSIMGHDLWWPRLVQMLMGTAACLMLYFAARSFFDQRTALISAIMLALYPPALFFDGLIQKTSLALFLSCALLSILASCAKRKALVRCGLAGFVAGGLILARQNTMALVPLLAAWTWFAPSKGGISTASKTRSIGLVGLTVGLVVALSPWALRNWKVTGEFVLTTPNLGQNFAMGHHPQGTGSYLPSQRGRASAETEQDGWSQAAELAEGRKLSPTEVSDYYLRSTWAYIKDDPADWLLLTGKKWAMTWGAYEAFDTEDYYLYHQHSRLLHWLDAVWHFGVLCPLAAVGLLLTWSRRKGLWLLYGWLGLTSLSVTAFVVFARYRFGLVPVLMMFAAAGLIRCVPLIRGGQFRPILAAGGCALVAGLFCNWPMHHPRNPSPVSYTNHGAALAAQGRYEEDLIEIGKALVLEPNNVDAHLAAGGTLMKLGNYAGAKEHYVKAVQGDPSYAGAYRGLADALAKQGMLAEAKIEFEKAVARDASDPLALNGLGMVLAQQGEVRSALELFEKALAIDPTLPEAHLNQGNTWMAVGRMAEAARSYRQALRHRPDYADAMFNLGVLYLNTSRMDEAAKVLRRAAELAPDRQDIQRALAVALGN